MTTLLGIKTNSGIEGIVIATDKQVSHWNEGVFTKKTTINKIFHGNNYIIANTGAIGDNPFAILEQTQKEELVQLVEEAVKKYRLDPSSEYPHFEKINHINTLLYREHEDEDYLHTLLMATNTNEKLELWEVDHFGSLKTPQKKKKIEYHVLGSGKKYVKKYIKRLLEKGAINQAEITIHTAIDIAIAAIQEAQKDPHTSGLDLAVLTNNGATYYGDLIKEIVEKQKKEIINSIKKDYRKV